MRAKIKQHQLTAEEILFVNVKAVIRLQHSGHFRNECIQFIALGIHRTLLSVG